MKSQVNRARSKAAASPAWYRLDWFWGLALVLAVVLVYLPAWNAGFLWDDDHHLTANPVIVGPLGLKEIWTTHAAMICPLVLTTFWLEHAVWGLAPAPYHVVNVLLHAACAVVLWRVLRSLEIPGAWLGAALWALHPVQVESAAYVSELKNTQSGLFYLLTILFYVKSVRGETKGAEARLYVWTLLFAALAITSKFSTVVLPAVLALSAWWAEGRWHWRRALRLLPIVAMAVIAVAIMLAPQPPDPTKVDNFVAARSWPERLVGAGDVAWFYLGKLAWPHPLMFVYPTWRMDAGAWTAYLPLLALAGVLLALWWKRESPLRGCFFALAYFVAVISPFLGLVDEDFWTYSYVEDHLLYLASMGPMALVGAGIWLVPRWWPSAKAYLTPALGAAMLVLLGALSWERTWVFQNDDALWSDTLAKNPDCPMARTNLGLLDMDREDFAAAAAQFQAVLKNHPANVTAGMDLGMAYLKTGQLDGALAQFRQAVEQAGNFPIGHYDLGVALMQKGEADEAEAEFAKAVAICPDYAAASNDLAVTLLKKGELDKAGAQFQRTLEINPNFPDAHFNLGLVLLQRGQAGPACEQFEDELRVNPQNAQAEYELATVLAQEGKLADAAPHYESALQIKPDFVDAHYNLGVAYLQMGRGQEASAQFMDVLQLNPQDKDAASNLAKAQALAAHP